MGMGQGGATPGDGKTAPFGDGNGGAGGGEASGAIDFTKATQGGQPKSGGRDFTKEHRPQSEANKEVAYNPQSVPSGGPVLKADPGPVSAKVAGPAPAIKGPVPFKGMK